MTPQNRSAKIIGAFFILATAASVLAAVLIGPVLSAPDYVAAMAQNANTLALAAASMLAAVVEIIGIPVALYPMLRHRNEGLALWFLTARLLEAVFYTLGIVCFLALWAFIGGVLLFAQGILVMFEASSPMLEATLFIPVALNEMVLAGWLLIKEFNTPLA